MRPRRLYFKVPKYAPSDLLLKASRLFLPYLVRTARSRILLALTVFLVVVDIATTACMPYYTKRLVECLSEPTLAGALAMIMAVFAVLWWLDRALGYIQDIVFFPIINDSICQIQGRVVQHLHTVPWRTYQNLSTPKILSVLKRIGLSARWYLRTLCLMITSSVLKVVTSLAVLWHFKHVDQYLIGGLVLYLIFYTLGMRLYLNARHLAWQGTDLTTLAIHDQLMMPHIARIYPKPLGAHLEATLSSEAKGWWETIYTQNSVQVLATTLLVGSFVLALYSGAKAVLDQTIRLSDFILLKTQMLAIFAAVRVFAVEVTQLVEASTDINDLLHYLDMPKNTVKHIDFTDALPPNVMVDLKDIAFEHEPGIRLLQSVDLQICTGDRILITGLNGCGKSTLGNIICGFVPHVTGQLRMRPGPYPVHIIPQNGHLLNHTVRFNLTFGIEAVSDAEIERVLKLTELTDCIDELGLDALVGERGTYLSMGQTQRLLIARALLIRPNLLILDETTNALPADQAKRMLQVLATHMQSILLISHHHDHYADFATHVYRIENGTLRQV